MKKISLEINNQIIKRLGFYTVGEENFNHKIDALLRATETKKPISWYFNNDVFSTIDWTTEPPESLTALYKQRALQLREKYDYLVLNYSAGSDSQNVLDTFLNNNIRLDEILVRWPKDGYANHQPSLVSRPDNVSSEWHFTIQPQLNRIKQSHPEIHIEFVDVTHGAYNMIGDNDPWYKATTGAILAPGHIDRWMLGHDRYQKMFVEKGIRCCQIFGTDKPRLMYDDGTFYTFFLDVIIGSIRNLINYNDEYNALELFYWTPDMPKLVQKQAHVMMDFFQTHPKFLPVISKDTAMSWVFRNTFEVLSRGLLYPSWNASLFQAPKPTSMITCEIDDWFFDSVRSGTVDTRSYDIWKESIDFVTRNIDPGYLTFDNRNRLNSMTGLTSPFYKLGEIDLESLHWHHGTR